MLILGEKRNKDKYIIVSKSPFILLQYEAFDFLYTNRFQCSSSRFINWEQLELEFHVIIHIVLNKLILWTCRQRGQDIISRIRIFFSWNEYKKISLKLQKIQESRYRSKDRTKLQAQ